MQSATLESQQKRLNQLIGLISEQETKLNRLKLLSNQAKEQSATNLELSNELNSVNKAINNKDEELKRMLDRVDELTAYLFNYRMTKSFSKSKNNINNKQDDIDDDDETKLNQQTKSTNAKTLPIAIDVIKHQRKQQSKNSTPPKSINNSANTTPISTSSRATTSTLTTTGATSIKANSCDQDEQKSNKQPVNDIARRVSFTPLALFLDAALQGELDLVIKTLELVPHIDASFDGCPTALHHSVIGGHYDITEYLIKAGCDVNVPDKDGWTPLHCAANSNNLPLAKLLIENGASIYARNIDNLTPAMACEKDEPNYQECYDYLVNIENSLGVINDGIVYALYDYKAQQEDELDFKTGDELKIMPRDDVGESSQEEQGWCWAQRRIKHRNDLINPSDGDEIEKGFIPKNLIGLFPRVKSSKKMDNLDVTNSNGTSDVAKSIGDLVID